MMGPRGDAQLRDDKAWAEGVACSICLDAVNAGGGGGRSTARLQCGHEFHLDCIGSAFNAKGLMQCPNCRKVEKGNWLYASASPSLPDLNMHEQTHDEYDLNYLEMLYRIYQCPFGRLARVTSSFEEGESSPAISFQDLVGHHAVFSEHPTTSSASAHPCPYMTYLQPLHPPSTSNSHVFSGNLVEGPAYHHHWSQVPGPADVHNPHALPANHSWEHHSAAYPIHGNRINSTDPASVSSVARPPMLDSDGMPRAGSHVHPFFLRHRSRASGLFASSLVPQYISNPATRPHVHEHYHHRSAQGNQGTVYPGVRQSGVSRGLTSSGPPRLSPPDHTGFYYLFPRTRTSGQNLQDVEDPEGSHFYAWERDRFAPFPLLRVDREPGWWGPVPQSTASLETSSSMGFWHPHGAERSSSQG